SANHSTASIKLSVLYRIFVLEKDSQQRIFTGHEQSDCEISRNIAKTMSHYNQKEHRVILNFYDTLTINDVINDTLQEDTTYDTL
ncbi:transcriptional regulator, partial [Corynebacterium diphtheriae]